MTPTQKIESLINSSETATGMEFSTLTAAVQELISGYGSGGGMPESFANIDF